MRLLIQRVTQASVIVEDRVCGAIGPGILAFLGVCKTDAEPDADYLAEKLVTLRIFTDAAGKMNLSLADVGGSALVVSQFTLYGSTAKGRRPSFDAAAPPDIARSLYEYFIRALQQRGVNVQTGLFQAHMQVSLTNDGPVTFLLESPTRILS